MTNDSRTDGQVGRHGAAVVNGPEDDVLDWLSIDWPQVEDDVRRLRQRIFTASRGRGPEEGPQPAEADAPVSRQRSYERAAGDRAQRWPQDGGRRRDRVVTAPGKAFLAESVQHHDASWRPKPVKRVYIPKANGKQRPLGIPVIVDRVRQAQVVNALEPEWEARFEPKSYGFRPGRGCHDAIECIFNTRRAASTPAGAGCSTQTWQRRSTESTIPTCSPLSAASLPGN